MLITLVKFKIIETGNNWNVSKKGWQRWGLLFKPMIAQIMLSSAEEIQQFSVCCGTNHGLAWYFVVLWYFKMAGEKNLEMKVEPIFKSIPQMLSTHSVGMWFFLFVCLFNKIIFFRESIIIACCGLSAIRHKGCIVFKGPDPLQLLCPLKALARFPQLEKVKFHSARAGG